MGCSHPCLCQWSWKHASTWELVPRWGEGPPNCQGWKLWIPGSLRLELSAPEVLLSCFKSKSTFCLIVQYTSHQPLVLLRSKVHGSPVLHVSVKRLFVENPIGVVHLHTFRAWAGRLPQDAAWMGPGKLFPTRNGPWIIRKGRRWRRQRRTIVVASAPKIGLSHSSILKNEENCVLTKPHRSTKVPKDTL